MKKLLTAILLMVVPTIISAETIPNNTIGISPGIIETEMLPTAELERKLVLMRSILDHDESYTVSIAGDTTNLVIYVPDNLLLPRGQQQIEFPLIIRTTGAPLGTYDVIVTFTPNQATTILTDAPTTDQAIAIGIATKIHITVVDQTTSQPYWLWLGGGIVLLTITSFGTWRYLFRNLH